MSVNPGPSVDRKATTVQFDDQGLKTIAVDFAYEEIDKRLSEDAGQPEFDPVDAACQCQRKVWSWVYQPPCEDLDGFLCRSIIACWVFVPQLRTYSMTAIAGRFGKKKQSLGRWVEDFKRVFPELSRIEHIKHE